MSSLCRIINRLVSSQAFLSYLDRSFQLLVLYQGPKPRYTEGIIRGCNARITGTNNTDPSFLRKEDNRYEIYRG
ncbi:MAG: hypothetical protein ACI8SJ_001141 [Shewanella sp.]|jgi:hypothetical protein